MSTVFSRTGPATRLIPDMKFVCNGTIIGYTVAMRKESGEQDPIIQIWRRNSSECQSSVYVKVGGAIATNLTYCEDRATSATDMPSVYICQLKKGFQVAVQPGDILGFELPLASTDVSALLFASVVKAPTNYEFRQLLSTSKVVLSNEIKTYQELPLITVEFESGIS